MDTAAQDIIPKPQPTVVRLPPKLKALYRKARYYVLYGGRGSGKSWGVAIFILLECMRKPGIRVLCTRELQNSIDDSVHKLLTDLISKYGWTDYFYITKNRIIARNGSEIFYAGLRNNVNKIKSMEGVDIVWVEEAATVSSNSWEVLIPTIRKPGSRILITFNPIEEEDPTYERFILSTPPDTVRVFINWRDNPWFSAELDAERCYLEAKDPEAYQNVYEGKCIAHSKAHVFTLGQHYVIESFVPPEGTQFLAGADWGFSQDPTVLIRSWITLEPSGIPGVPDLEDLWIDHEAYAVGCELNDTPALFRTVPKAEFLPIMADSARPETISYMRRVGGFNVRAAKKWEGCVEDGVQHLKAFRMIHIHQRCKHTQDEFRHYSYKVDKLTGKVLNILVDAANHVIDAARYMLDKFVKKRGVDARNARL